jgi:HNH endonuclease
MAEKFRRWARGRRGACSLTLTMVLVCWMAAAPGQTPLGAIAASPVLLVVASAIIWFVASVWESKTLPRTPKFSRARNNPSSRMLREDLNAQFFTDRGGFLFERRHFFVATGLRPVRVPGDLAQRLALERQTRAVAVASNDSRQWWWFRDTFCWENCGYGPDDVIALLADRQRRHQRKLEHAHATLNAENSPAIRRRTPIPNQVKRLVWERDGARCVECESDFGLQYDHVIPLTKGGADTVDNLQLLCAPCNQAKGASLY